MMVMMMMVMVRMMMVPLCGSDLYGMYIKTGVFAKKRCMLSFVHKTKRLSGHLLELQNWIFSRQHIYFLLLLGPSAFVSLKFDTEKYIIEYWLLLG